MRHVQANAAAATHDAPGDELESDPVVAYRKHLAGSTNSIWDLTGGILGAPVERTPLEVSVSACFIDGDEAIIEATGKIDGARVCGRVVLRQYADSWYVQSENYMGCAPHGYCLDPK